MEWIIALITINTFKIAHTSLHPVDKSFDFDDIIVKDIFNTPDTFAMASGLE